MPSQNSKALNKVLIVSLIPYFLERSNFWFKENLPHIIKSSKTQLFWQNNILFIERNQSIQISKLLRKLDELGYEKVFKAENPGEFSQRGGIVDVFPINSEFAVRLEFLGSKVENIKKLGSPIPYNEDKEKEFLKKKLRRQKIFSDLKDIKPGDYLVHLDHGVGKFLKKEKLAFSNPDLKTKEYKEYYLLEYAQGDKLYVPLGLERKLSRYIGFTTPKISRLGTNLWQKQKRKVKEEAERIARELLSLYSKKEISRRKPYFVKDELEKEIEEGFPYNLTPDQIAALKDIEKDLQNTKPMDRVICGDVGFGKTEIALRVAVKAVINGYQVAFLSPTTILANQHYETFKKRLEKTPFMIALLSRLQKKREIKKITEKVKKGKIDILIGTHKILSSKLQFKNLQLLIIDDEQKFGVQQKEKLRKLNPSLDVLSLSATPIPRTLYLSLSSLKNISFIKTPPLGRKGVRTYVLPFQKKIVKNAIENELQRRGQIYYLHNKIETIEDCRSKIEALNTGAKIEVLHARLKEEKIIKIMADFQNQKINLLLTTTIIENGLDLPNVNTLIVDDARRLGLSQAYQIRGRIGRANIQSFSYFLYPKNKKLTSLAKERLAALKKAEKIGSGYKIALRDLELRGAGNVLGKEQSGNINKVGLNLYCQMLSQAIEKMRK
ncbi:DEAD/DEAH box helicase [bacterium]|nr:DEAD/DEAH box helicase [bacterium]